MNKKTPSERRHIRNKKAIVDAARKIIVKHGIESLSMRTLAEKVDYTPSALYKYFSSKEEILDAIRVEGFELLQSIFLHRGSNDLPPPQKLYQSAIAYLEFVDSYPEHYLLMFSTPYKSPGKPSSINQISEHPVFKPLIQMFREGVASGHFKLPEGYTPTMIAFQAWITLHGIAILKLTNLRDPGSGIDDLGKRIIKAQISNFSVK